jgi:hypothetical protein
MKGKYITTSLLMAILGSGRSVEVAETTANTQNHEITYGKAIPQYHGPFLHHPDAVIGGGGI